MTESLPQERIPDSVPPAFAEFLRRERHPETLADLWPSVYAPLARWVLAQSTGQQRPPVIGVNGCQGSGKSTLCSIIAWALSEFANRQTAVLSIDDLYYTRAERARLASEVHPLLRTRGVPGTHDVALGVATLSALTEQRLPVALPRFNKAEDDRLAPEAWPVISQPVDVVLFEGWCIGTQPQSEEALATPLNELEAVADVDCRWRRYINAQLVDEYPALWRFLDRLIFLQAPSFDCVQNWRWRQEQRLAELSPGSKVMTQQEVRQFIAYYQRLTQHNLATLPDRSDVVVQLNDQQQISKVSWQ